MSTPEQPLPKGGRDREDLARLDLERTIASRAIVGVLVGFFLVSIAIVPMAEWIAVSAGRAERIGAAWADLFALPREIRSGVVTASTSTAPGPWQLLMIANRTLLAGLLVFERALEDDALIARALRPPAQVVMSGRFGAGNERVYPGLDGWLFYRQDVDYVTGRGFLEPAEIQRRIALAPSWMPPPHPDPRPAILQFKRDLDARGIALIVVPTPHKPSVHPEKLAARYADPTAVLHNSSYRAFVDDLRAAGVIVFDPSEALAAARGSGPQYLATDTHWRPEAMEAVTDLLGELIAQLRLPDVADPGYRLDRSEMENIGDTARMLDLPEDARLFPAERVWLRRVLQPDGSLWRSSRDADVLVLGDSFTNIYTLESMGWGTSAGFVEQLSYTLARPIDRLVQNDEAAFSTRAMLVENPRRLDGKRVVVYQFAARELAFGDWKLLPLPTPF